MDQTKQNVAIPSGDHMQKFEHKLLSVKHFYKFLSKIGAIAKVLKREQAFLIELKARKVVSLTLKISTINQSTNKEKIFPFVYFLKKINSDFFLIKTYEVISPLIDLRIHLEAKACP